MTEDSAKRYDMQVEVLFYGTANLIRRQALPPLREAFAGRDQRRLRLLDLGCGTGRLLNFVKQCWPRLPCIGLDMSEPYLREARRHLDSWSWLKLVVGNGEMIPLPDASQDAITNVFMFHELPPEVRRAVFREFARVLKPGGRLIILDCCNAETSRIMMVCSRCSRKTSTSLIMSATSMRTSATSRRRLG